jgi:hypothetical protein
LAIVSTDCFSRELQIEGHFIDENQEGLPLTGRTVQVLDVHFRWNFWSLPRTSLIAEAVSGNDGSFRVVADVNNKFIFQYEGQGCTAPLRKVFDVDDFSGGQGLRINVELKRVELGLGGACEEVEAHK